MFTPSTRRAPPPTPPCACPRPPARTAPARPSLTQASPWGHPPSGSRSLTRRVGVVTVHKHICLAKDDSRLNIKIRIISFTNAPVCVAGVHLRVWKLQRGDVPHGAEQEGGPRHRGGRPPLAQRQPQLRLQPLPHLAAQPRARGCPDPGQARLQPSRQAGHAGE